MSFGARETKILTGRWYEELGRALRDVTDLVTFNYGWKDEAGAWSALALEPEEELSRFPLNLYFRVAAAAEVQGRDVLEVGCGRGGGARFVSRVLAPRRYFGVDRSHEGVSFAKARPLPACLAFMLGDAERLPAEDESFDVVLSVESAHAYGAYGRFLKEVQRVLRAGGLLSLADFGRAEDRGALEAALSEAKLETVEAHDLTQGVRQSIAAREPSLRGIAERLEEPLRDRFLSFAAIPGTVLERALADGQVTYFHLLARKA
ncbi:MAG: class I SAM-dependent methyltransferase [Deltaproteobacteria bacterium]|nr:class I SAM-dependent methyltransferase [Deltaproteobacteria bacterium]